jgi:beta-aspartyl-peptidase (threonine type)
MEDSPLFNAGKGAVFSSQGINELDASLMDGGTLASGAVAGVTRIKNPIVLARYVMERSWHVLLAGPGAEAFAAEQGMELVDRKYFFTQRRWDALEKARAKEAAQPAEKKHGTVGVIVLDAAGNLAAGTSTGGLTNKRFGRVGDSPIVGAGTYADNRTCGVSGTGQGEYFIRLGVARDISALMEYRGYDVQRACDTVIQEKLTALGGSGGVVALDARGNVGFSFNTSGMYRGYLKQGSEPITLIYKD